MSCSHTTPPRWVERTFVDNWTGETTVECVNEGGASSYVDISIGAMQCSQCGHVDYYTGHWRDLYERGIPCPSDNHPDVKLDAVRRAAGIQLGDAPIAREGVDGLAPSVPELPARAAPENEDERQKLEHDAVHHFQRMRANVARYELLRDLGVVMQMPHGVIHRAKGADLDALLDQVNARGRPDPVLQNQVSEGSVVMVAAITVQRSKQP